MSLKYTAHFAWDLSLEQIRTSSKIKKKEGQRDILNLKQKTIRSLSIWIYVCLSVCLFFFLFSDNIVEVVKTF